MARISRAVLVLSAVTAALVGLASPATAEVLYRESMRNFDLGTGIRSTHDVWNAIRRHGKTEVDAKTIRVGWANYRIGVSHKYAQRGQMCSLTDVKVKVDVIINVPSWKDQIRARPALSEFFSCVRRTVVIHEVRHGEIARETGERIERAYWTWLKDVPCAQFNARANEIFQRESERGNEAQSAFDKRDYARNRYNVCERIASGAQAAGRATIAPVNHPPRRTLRSGRAPQVLASRADDIGNDRPEADSLDQQAPGAQASSQPPRTPQAAPRVDRQGRVAPAPSAVETLSSELKDAFPSSLALVAALTLGLGLIVFLVVGRQARGSVSDDPSGFIGRHGRTDAPPAAWAEHALERLATPDGPARPSTKAGAEKSKAHVKAATSKAPASFGRRQPPLPRKS